MSWLSSIGDSIGSAFKSVGNGLKNVATGALSVVKKIATPALSFAAGLVPGVGPILSRVVDTVGNKLLGDNGDASQAADTVAQTPVADYLAQVNGQAIGLGSSSAAQALATATTQAAEPALAGLPSSGFLGIGDGKPGVFGIGTGANKARKAAEAEAAAAGKSNAQIKQAGEDAASSAKESPKPGGSGEAAVNPLLIGGGILLALLAL